MLCYHLGLSYPVVTPRLGFADMTGLAGAEPQAFLMRRSAFQQPSLHAYFGPKSLVFHFRLAGSETPG
jgi:hypothetical protein